MPCRDYMDDDDYRAQRARDEQEKRDYLTRIACRFAKALEDGETLDWMILQGDKGDKRTKEAVEWWKEHKRKDEEARLAREAEKARKEAEARMKKSILEKLSPEELEFVKKNSNSLTTVKRVRGNEPMTLEEAIERLQLGKLQEVIPQDRNGSMG